MFNLSFLVISLCLIQDVLGISEFTCYNLTEYCFGSGSQQNCYPCPRGRPFCDGNKKECSYIRTEVTDDSCPLTRDGAVPSLDSCRSYVICYNGVGYTVDCPIGQVYDPGSRSCQRRRLCYRFNCGPANEGLNIPYPGDPSFYAFCSGRRAVYLRSCEPGQQFIRTRRSTASGCQVFCPGIGKFPDYSNCRGYYTCTLNGGTLSPVQSSCPANQFFSPDRGECTIDDAEGDVVCSENVVTTT